MNEIGLERYERFLELRRHGKIGPLWVKDGMYALSTPPCYMFDDAEHVSVETICRIIDYWFPGRWRKEIERRQVARETRHARYALRNCNR